MPQTLSKRPEWYASRRGRRFGYTAPCRAAPHARRLSPKRSPRAGLSACATPALAPASGWARPRSTTSAPRTNAQAAKVGAACGSPPPDASASFRAGSSGRVKTGIKGDDYPFPGYFWATARKSGSLQPAGAARSARNWPEITFSTPKTPKSRFLP